MSIPLRVLLVEDSQDDAELLAYELERSGYDILNEPPPIQRIYSYDE